MTYPIELPRNIAAQQAFELQRVDYLSPEAGGRLGAIAAGNPLWTATWNIGKIGTAKSDEIRAWVARMRGPMRTFFGYDVARIYPKLYPKGFGGMSRAGGGAFTGPALTWSQTIDAEGDAILELSGLPAGFSIEVGDYVGFRWGSALRRTLARAIERTDADGAGVASLRVEPPVPTLVVPPDAVAHLDNPFCVMRLVPDQYELGPIDRRLSITGGRITAVQDLRP